MKFNQLKLRAQLLIAFSIVLIFIVIVGSVSYSSFKSIGFQGKITTLVNAKVDALFNARLGQADYMISNEKEFIESNQAKLKEANAIANELQGLMKVQSSIDHVDLIKKNINIYGTHFKEYVTLEQEQDKAFLNAERYANIVLGELNAISTSIDKFFTANPNTFSEFGRYKSASQLKEDYLMSLISFTRYTGDNDPKYIASATMKLDSLQQAMPRLKAQMLSAETRKNFDNASKALENYRTAMLNYVSITDKKLEMSAKMLTDANTATKDAYELRDAEKAIAAKAETKAITLIIIFGLIAILFGVWIAFAITRLIMLRLGGEPYEMENISSEIAAGNLAFDTTAYSNRSGAMQNIVTMAERLKTTLAEIIASSNIIASSSDQVSGTSQQLSQGANEQAASVEEVSSTMEEIAANINQNTDNAKQTETIATNAQKGIEDVNNQTQESVKASQLIAEKIDIVSEIAFQTNILALNAAVEAARAGESGKGFAVVAAEVRKLAERSKIAAEEIVTQAGRSLEIAESAGTKMNEILPEVVKTAELVREITSASIEQNNGAGQINNAIQQMSSVTQQNASASEELASSAEEMTSQSQQLRDLISFFKIE